MNILQKPLIENYILEVIARSISVKKECSELLVTDFVSEHPKNLLITIKSICDYLERISYVLYDAINWKTDLEEDIIETETLLQFIDYLIKELGSHIRYAYGARTLKLPWHIINSLESFVDQLLPGTNIMLGPQWKYNYSILPVDLYEIYYNSLYEFQDYTPNIELEQILKSLPKPFHLVSFPSIEKENVLLHCLIGHEIGHLYTKDYVSREKQKIFLETIRPYIEKISTNKVRSRSPEETPDLFFKQQLQKQIQFDLNSVISYWRKGLEEIIADIVGVLLFGPAVLFSTLEIACQHELDIIPSPESKFYPPWRMRLREILNILEDSENKFFPLPNNYQFSEKTKESMLSTYNSIKELTLNTSDQEAISQNEIRKISYNEIKKEINKATTVFKKKLKEKNILKAKKLYEHLPELIERIDNGIPPNEYEIQIDKRKPATIVEIINASWFHKISWTKNIFNKSGKIKKNIFIKKDKMNRLTLKAIEYSHLELKYRKNFGKISKFRP